MIDIRSFLRDHIVSLEIAHEFGSRLGLEYVPEHEAEGRVCMAAHLDVRPEFRNSFTSAQVSAYINAILRLNKELPKDEVLIVPYPVNTMVFWKLVQRGSELA